MVQTITKQIQTASPVQSKVCQETASPKSAQAVRDIPVQTVSLVVMSAPSTFVECAQLRIMKTGLESVLGAEDRKLF